MDQLELIINKISSVIDVDLMPGEFDISSAVMPQQPLNKALFPMLVAPTKVNFVTNPHQFNINGIRFLGTSGQNIKDIRMFSDGWKDPVDILEHSLMIRHTCPTSPDTLRSYSFTESDPFIISDAPHVYFAGNQPLFGEKFVNQKTSKMTYPDCEEQKSQDNFDLHNQTKVISVPSFRTTKKLVLLDL